MNKAIDIKCKGAFEIDPFEFRPTGIPESQVSRIIRKLNWGHI